MMGANGPAAHRRVRCGTACLPLLTPLVFMTCRSGQRHCEAPSALPQQSPSPPIAQEPTIGDFVGERVPETVFDVRVEPCLLQELGSLQLIETTTERLLWQLCDRLQQN